MEAVLVAPSRVRSASSLVERTVANDDFYLDAADPASSALTDFRREFPIAVDADEFTEDALADMNRLAVHALLVTQEGAEDADARVIGLITANDIERNGRNLSLCPRVRDVMTPWNELPLVKYESLQALTALDLYRMFQGTGLTHLLVIEIRDDASAETRGLLSRAALAKRLRRARGARWG